MLQADGPFDTKQALTDTSRKMLQALLFSSNVLQPQWRNGTAPVMKNLDSLRECWLDDDAFAGDDAALLAWVNYAIIATPALKGAVHWVLKNQGTAERTS